MADNETQLSARPNPTGAKLENAAAPGIPYFVPKTTPSIGSLLPAQDFPQNKNPPKAFQPIKIRDYEFKNRIWVSPMCQYSCESGTGIQTDWHVVNAGSFARGGAGLVTIEATAVLPNGPISPEDSGIWGDQHIAPLKRIVDFIHSQGAVAAIQLAHAGRKGSTWAPWVTDGLVTPNNPPKPNTMVAGPDHAGFRENVWGPSEIPFDAKHATPKEMTKEDINTLLEAFKAATIRAEKAGFDVIEVHAAHGYLLHNFLSPLSNHRTDEYGGSLENRLRLTLETIDVVRANFPKGKPVFLRLSATDWHEKGEKGENGEWISWGVEQSIELAKKSKERGIDLIDVSSGGNYSGQQIKLGPKYQAGFAKSIRDAVPDLLIGSVGLISNGKEVEEVLNDQQADVVFAARAWLRDPNWALSIASELGVAVSTPVQYQRAFTRMYKEHA